MHDPGPTTFHIESESSIKILVADDERPIRTAICYYLGDLGYRTYQAEDGIEALSIIEDVSPNLVLLDLRMPQMGGIEVLKRMSNHHIDIPVIVISGHGGTNDVVQALRAGAYDYLQKPLYDMDMLKYALERALEKKRLLVQNADQYRQLEHANDKLGAALDEATEARKQAEKAYMAKTEFLEKISNDLRIPCLGIESMADILRDTSLSDEQHTYLRIIQSSIASLSGAISELVEYSKIETHKFSLERNNFDIETLVQKEAEKTTRLFNDNTINTEVSIDDMVPRYLIGDPWRINQILHILLENAFKFTTNGTIHIRVSAQHIMEDAAMVKFTVEDEGIGIQHEALAGLFDAFNKGDNHINFSGIGLGLTLAKKLCAAMGGQIGVSSTLGKGSVFWFTLRLDIQPDNQRLDDTDVVKISQALENDKDISSKSILLVDTNSDSQIITSAFLTRLNFDYRITQTGTDALSMLENEHFDCLLMDTQVKDMSGFELAGVIRSDLSAVLNHEIPIIALTSDMSSDYKKRCLTSGMNRCLPRPFSFAQLLIAINEVINTD